MSHKVSTITTTTNTDGADDRLQEGDEQQNKESCIFLPFVVAVDQSVYRPGKAPGHPVRLSHARVDNAFHLVTYIH